MAGLPELCDSSCARCCTSDGKLLCHVAQQLIGRLFLLWPLWGTQLQGIIVLGSLHIISSQLTTTSTCGNQSPPSTPYHQSSLETETK